MRTKFLRSAYQSETNGVARLVWSDGDIVAELTSDALPADELRRLAESAVVTPEDDRP